MTSSNPPQQEPSDRDQLLEMWDFPWPVMEVLIGGKSSIDLAGLSISSWEDATQFLKTYGYDPERPDDLRRVHAVIVEALSFIENELLTETEVRRGLAPPEEIQRCEDARDLLLKASSSAEAGRWDQAWACAVLRVMHTIAHIEGVNRLTRLEDAREQIMGRFERRTFRDDDAGLWLGDPSDAVPLVKVEWKYAKTRDSTILKLLHKRDNVAETIYDIMGVRIVTERMSDVLRAVKCLRRFHMVSFPNCYPFRSRNNLIDLERFRTQVDTLRDMLAGGALSPEEFQDAVARLTAPQNIGMRGGNPHSARQYRSIQLTGRQLIRVPNPEFRWLRKLERALEEEALPPAGRAVVEEWVQWFRSHSEICENREVRSFFPFEVQVMDWESYRKTLTGAAAHDRYKQSQVRAARKRVLGQVLSQWRS